MKRNTLKRIALLSLCLMMVVTFLPIRAASAANACVMVSGSSKGKTVFTVETTSRWLWLKDKIKFTATKGKCEYDNALSVLKTAWKYDTFRIEVKNLNTGEFDVYYMTGGSKTIKLRDNTKYQITVVPSTNRELEAKFKFQVFYEWDKYSYPTWEIKWTKGVNLCSKK